MGGFCGGTSHASTVDTDVADSGKTGRSGGSRTVNGFSANKSPNPRTNLTDDRYDVEELSVSQMEVSVSGSYDRGIVEPSTDVDTSDDSSSSDESTSAASSEYVTDSESEASRNARGGSGVLSPDDATGSEDAFWKRDYGTQRGDISGTKLRKKESGGASAAAGSSSLLDFSGAAGVDPKKQEVIAKDRGLTIVLHAVEGDPKDVEESPMMKKKKGKKVSSPKSAGVSAQYMSSTTIPTPSWLDQKTFYLTLSEFANRLNPKTKKAVWFKCFTKKGASGPGSTAEILKKKEQFLKLITACSMIYVKSKLQQAIREKEAKPHLTGCAEFIFDVHRQLHMKSFINEKSYWSNMLKEYHIYIQDLSQS